MNIKLFTLTIILVCATGLFASRPKLTINYVGEVEVDEDRIKFRDIATITGGDSDFEDLLNSEVGRSANYGRTRYLSTSPLYKRLLAPLEEHYVIDVQGPDRLKITTASRILSRERVFEIIEEYVAKNRKPSAPELEFEVAAMPKTIHVPNSDYNLELVSTGAAPLKGMHKLHLKINSAGKVQRKVPINIFIRHFKMVWVANRKISRGVEISTSDLRKERRDITKVPGIPIENVAQLGGSTSRQVIVKDRILTNKLLRLKRVIKQGDRVEVTAIKNGIVITIGGIARQDGVIGQTIRVKNLSSHKLVKAMVMEDGTLEFVSLAGNS